MGFPGGSDGKESDYNAGELDSIPGSERIPRRREWQPAPVFFMFACMKSKMLQLCRTLCDPRDCSLPGSYVRGFLQARILEWVAISSSRRSSGPRD